MLKYVWTSPKVNSVFTAREMEPDDMDYDLDFLWVKYEFSGHEHLMRKSFLAEDIKCGIIAVWNGQEYTKLKWGRWMSHQPRGAV